MVTYVLKDSSEFVGIRSSSSGLQVLKPRKDDDPDPNIKEIVAGLTIGNTTSSGRTYSELKVFNGIIKGASLIKLMTELKDKKIWVNRDGYRYMLIPGSKSTTPAQPTKFIRLNELFYWKDYVGNFNPTPSTTVWNRFDTSHGEKKKDYQKLEVDLKQAKDDKKKAEEDKKKAEDKLDKAKKGYEDKLNKEKKEYLDKLNKIKKEYEDKVQQVRKQIREMNERMDRIKENWVKAAIIGARPLPPSAFYISSIPKTDPMVTPIYATWLGHTHRYSELSKSYMDSIRSGSIHIHNADKAYGNNDDFEKYFWWVVQVDYPNDRVYGIKIAFDGTGRYPSPTDQYKFQSICVANRNSGTLPLSVIGAINVIVLTTE